LAAGKTGEEAARLAGVSTSTIYRRKRDRAFAKAVDRARSELIDRTVGSLSDGSSEGVQTMRDLNRNARSEAIRLGAARALVEFALRARDQETLSRRLDEIERKLAGEPEEDD
jgi:hypothetical protein